MITIHGNGAIKTIIVIEHLRNNVKRPKMSWCCIFQNNITYEENVMFTTKFKVVFHMYYWLTCRNNFCIYSQYNYESTYHKNNIFKYEL
jgi:hypothetical protein